MSGTPERQLVLNWLANQLQGVVGSDGEFDLNPSGEPSRFPAIFIEESDQDADDATEPGATRYVLSFGIEGYVAGGGSLAATADRSALYAAALAACVDETAWPDCIEEVHEGGMRLATATLAEKRRLGFNLTIAVHFVVSR